VSQRSPNAASRPRRQECDERHRGNNKHKDTGERQLD
jgi:hypothetical protein